jgi:hypothetical protein
MFAGAAEVDVRAKRKPFRLAPMALHSRLPENPSCTETILNRSINEALSSGATQQSIGGMPQNR